MSGTDWESIARQALARVAALEAAIVAVGPNGDVDEARLAARWVDDAVVDDEGVVGGGEVDRLVAQAQAAVRVLRKQPDVPKNGAARVVPGVPGVKYAGFYGDEVD